VVDGMDETLDRLPIADKWLKRIARFEPAVLESFSLGTTKRAAELLALGAFCFCDPEESS